MYEIINEKENNILMKKCSNYYGKLSLILAKEFKIKNGDFLEISNEKIKIITKFFVDSDLEILSKKQADVSFKLEIEKNIF
jgi:hypothetical protein